MILAMLLRICELMTDITMWEEGGAVTDGKDMVKEAVEEVSLVEEDTEEEEGVGIEITMMDTSMSTTVGDTLPTIMTITGSLFLYNCDNVCSNGNPN